MKSVYKKIVSMELVAILCFTLLPIAFAADAEEKTALPESVLYYGTVKQIVCDDDGEITSLHLSSERPGDYVMNISEDTVWIDSGKKTVSDPDTLEVGETVYICHSAIATVSLPPQSLAYAVVCNVPQDAGCAQYMTVDSVESKNGMATIVANNKTVTFSVDADTTFSPYRTKNIVTLHDVKEGSRIMVWYSYSKDISSRKASHIMLLPDVDTEEAAGKAECWLLSFWKKLKD